MTTVRYYGILTDLAGKSSEEMETNGVNTFSDLQEMLKSNYPGFDDYPIVFFQNSRHCTSEDQVQYNVDIDCMPPFSGG